MKLKIGVIGGGVNGIGSALAILEEFQNFEVTVYSENFSPFTTGDGSAGLWTPYLLPDTEYSKIEKWSRQTWNFMQKMWKQAKNGVFLTNVRKVSKQEVEIPIWKNNACAFKEFSQIDLKQFGNDYISGYSYEAFVAEPSIFLPELMQRISEKGGKFVSEKITQLSDICEKVDIIVNCAGIGAYELVPDSSVYPIRGQVIRISNPRIKMSTFDLSDDSYGYIIPNTTNVILGGIRQSNDWRTSIDPADREFILKNTSPLEPSIKSSEIVEEWAGLRPARKGGVRLELSEINYNGRPIPIVHNYGHGGSGVTLFWGCSQEVKNLLRKVLVEKIRFSKL